MLVSVLLVLVHALLVLASALLVLASALLMPGSACKVAQIGKVCFLHSTCNHFEEFHWIEWVQPAKGRSLGKHPHISQLYIYIYIYCLSKPVH